MGGSNEEESAYQRGFCEAFVAGSKCPYPEMSVESDEWWDGYGDGTERLWYAYGPEDDTDDE